MRNILSQDTSVKENKIYQIRHITLNPDAILFLFDSTLQKNRCSFRQTWSNINPANTLSKENETFQK